MPLLIPGGFRQRCVCDCQRTSLIQSRGATSVIEFPDVNAGYISHSIYPFLVVLQTAAFFVGCVLSPESLTTSSSRGYEGHPVLTKRQNYGWANSFRANLSLRLPLTQCISKFAQKMSSPLSFYAQRTACRFTNESCANLCLIAVFEDRRRWRRLLLSLNDTGEGRCRFQNTIVRYRGQFGGAFESSSPAGRGHIFGDRRL